MDNIIPALMPFMIVGVVLMIYFLPCALSFFRGHKHRWAISFLSICLGWTVVFWVACMTWALMNQVEVKNG